MEIATPRKDEAKSSDRFYRSAMRSAFIMLALTVLVEFLNRREGLLSSPIPTVVLWAFTAKFLEQANSVVKAMRTQTNE